jgi:hypothetical protein
MWRHRFGAERRPKVVLEKVDPVGLSCRVGVANVMQNERVAIDRVLGFENDDSGLRVVAAARSHQGRAEKGLAHRSAELHEPSRGGVGETTTRLQAPVTHIITSIGE